MFNKKVQYIYYFCILIFLSPFIALPIIRLTIVPCHIVSVQTYLENIGQLSTNNI